MTDTLLLKKVIDSSGFKLSHIADKMNITRQGLYNKMHNKSEFTIAEMNVLCDILKPYMSKKTRDAIFFAKYVEEISTY